ncbi:MAG: aminotransferase class V-fold PLP-dependent enzyme [Trueperaceae bacterium]|nr:aminotransferase class V-fold PLP-dependent enzyme [Trueperaceae bacterium]
MNGNDRHEPGGVPPPDGPSEARPDGAQGFATRQLHAGQRPDPATGARAVPIYATTSYQFQDAAHAEGVFAGTAAGNQYGRMDNPTVRVLADRLADLEGRPPGSGVVLSSGQAATSAVMLALASPGREWLVTNQLFGGTAAVANKILDPLGVRVRYVDPDPDAVRAAAGPDTVGVWVETLANPSGTVPDLPALADAAHAAGAPLVVDNTFACGGYLCLPLAQGADAVVHSATKWIGGHGVALGGAVIDGGSFDWHADPDRHPGFHRPDARGRTVLQKAPHAPLAARVKDLGLTTMGMTLGPQEAFLLLQGLETLSLRVQRCCDTALALAPRLGELEGVREVVYPGLPGHPSHQVARRVLRHGYGAVLGLAFEDEATARGTLDRLRLISHLANIGDAKTVAIHPWTTTHAGLREPARRAAGVTPDLVRLSVGLEDPGDILADLAQAVRGAREARPHPGEEGNA